MRYIKTFIYLGNQTFIRPGWEPLSNGYGRTPVFKSTWVQIQAQDTGRTFVHIDLL